ncbi:MAG: putative transrane protein [Polaromonas sp.]|nr:putative transrane protein [Polaromonas sp.]
MNSYVHSSYSLRMPMAGSSISRALRRATVVLAASIVLPSFAATELGNAAQQTSRTRQPAATTTTAAPATSTSTASGRVVPTPLYGVTVDDVSGLDSITQSLSRLAKKPTTRIVFDEFVDPGYYRNPAVQINKVSYVMGEVLDSFYMPQYSVPAYVDRTRQYLAALSDVVDIWEIGNEINGEWLGNNADVVAKMTGAYDLVKSQAKTTALTLYYNQGCWERSSNEMFRWTDTNVPYRMKQGLDYVFISYYEDDCNGLKPDWQAVFQKLSVMFPNSKIGFGEVGTAKKTNKAAYLTRYYTMKITAPRYVGGHFWWYYRQDMVPYTKALWSTLNTAISAP